MTKMAPNGPNAICIDLLFLINFCTLYFYLYMYIHLSTFESVCHFCLSSFIEKHMYRFTTVLLKAHVLVPVLVPVHECICSLIKYT